MFAWGFCAFELKGCLLFCNLVLLRQVEGHVTGFGNPEWAATHASAKSTAPAVQARFALQLCCGNIIPESLLSRRATELELSGRSGLRPLLYVPGWCRADGRL